MIKSPTLAILIPAHNELSNLTNLSKILSSCASLLPSQTELIVIDDASSDGTSKYTVKVPSNIAYRYLKNKSRLGKTASILLGYAQTKSKYIALLDADLITCLPVLVKQLALIESGFVTTQNPFSWKRPIRPRPSRGPKIFPRHVFSHISQRYLNEWNLESELIFTARNLGLIEQKVACSHIHTPRHKSLGLRIKRFLSSRLHNISRLFSSPVYTTLPEGLGMVGAGLTFRRQEYITHSTLPHHYSALKTFASWQVVLISLLIASTGWGIVTATVPTLIVLTASLSFIYLLDVIFNLYVTLKSLHFPPEIIATSLELSKISNKDLPIYSILVPLYKEANVLPHFIESINQLDYPKEKLDILLLLEEDDTETIRQARSFELPPQFRLVIVPPSSPKTKPKACNYGLSLAKGEFIVIYDAEDRPEPMQLKRAYLALRKSGNNIGCVQAKLNYFNPHDNLLTRFFTAEYSLWFDVILPGLQSIKTTIPLGGTSNHFRTQLLRDLHGWDAFNVTEDADLGTRLFNAGYQTAIIDSTTLEEANNNLANWVRQRSRWLKGYMQTYLVHMRHPLTLWRKQGIHALLFNLIVGGKISFILINPFLWVMTIGYFALYAYMGPFIESIYPTVVFYMAITSLVVGNFVALYNYMIGCAKRGHWDLVKYVYLIPIYWLMISYAAAIALWQLIIKPHYWEKTLHGLHLEYVASTDLKRLKKIELSRYRGVKFQKLSDKFNLKIVLGGGVLIFSAFLGNLLNFIYNAYLGRVANLEDFGVISLISSILYISYIPLGALSSAVNHKSAYLLGKYGVAVKEFWQKIRHQALFTALAMTVIWLTAIPLLMTFFKTDDYIPFLLFAPVWIVGTLNSVDSGFLSGNLKFSTIAYLGITESLSKLGFTVFLVSLGLSRYVYAAIPLSITCVCFLAWLKAKSLKSSPLLKQNNKELLYFPSKFFFTSMLTALASITYLSLDLILVKHYLIPSEAGKYAILTLAGKMVYFIGFLFSQFTVPLISHNLGEGKDSSKTFGLILALVTTVNTVAYLAFGIFGSVFVPMLWGGKAILIIPYLPVYILAMVIYSLASTMINYNQVKGRYIFPFVGIGVGLAQSIAIVLFHDSIETISYIVLFSSISSLISVIILDRYYKAVIIVFHNIIDLLGLFRPLPEFIESNRDKLRILIFNWRDTKHMWAGGAEVYLQELSKRWVARGHQVTIFSGNDGHSKRHDVIDGVRIIRRGGFYLVYLWAFLYYRIRFKGRYDVIIDSENGLPFFTPLYCKEKVFLLIHHVHQEVFRISLVPPLSWIALFLEKHIMPIVYRKTEVLTVSPSSKADIIAHKLTKRNPYVVYNGVNLDICTPGKKSTFPTVLYLGRLTTAKSINILILAAQIVIQHVPKVKIIIAGDGPCKKNLVRIVKKLKLDNYISFTGKVSEQEKLKLYQQAWVFVNPSLIEGWGITTIEANACGTPVVASNVAGLRDAVHNPHSGVLVPYGNVEEFAKSITKLLTNATIRHRMSQESVYWAKKFDWNHSANQLLTIINTL